jgi:hypothetical protein
LVAFDATQSTVLSSKDADWQQQRPDCPKLQLNPTSLTFNGVMSETNLVTQNITISNLYTATRLTWSAVNDAGWLKLDSITGTAPSTVTMSVDMVGLSAGIHTGTITISSTEAMNSPQNVTVTLMMTSPQPTPTAIPTITPTTTSSWTPTNTPTHTATPTETPSLTETPTYTPIPTDISTHTPTITPTNTPQPTSTSTPTHTSTPTLTTTPIPLTCLSLNLLMPSQILPGRHITATIRARNDCSQTLSNMVISVTFQVETGSLSLSRQLGGPTVTHQETIAELSANSQVDLPIPLFVGSDVPGRARLSARMQGTGVGTTGVAQAVSSFEMEISQLGVYLPVIMK